MISTGVSQDIDTNEISYEVSFTDSLGHHRKINASRTN